MKVVYMAHSYRADTEWGVFTNIISAHVYAKQLWDKGYAVINPLSNTAWMGTGTFGFNEVMAGDFEILSRCDILVLCPGWERSEGCRMEYEKALAGGLKIYTDINEVPYES